MTGPEHYRRAEEILSHVAPGPENVAVAQVHATLATVVDDPVWPLHIPGSAGSDWPAEGPNGLEREMINKAKIGEPVHREGPFNLESMQSWGPDREIRAEALRHLLTAGQWPVDAKGICLHGVVISGQLDLESVTLRCPLHLENCYFECNKPVILEYATASVLALTGCRMPELQAGHLAVTRKLDLAGTTFTGPVRLTGTNITAQLNMRGALLTTANKDGSALMADGLKVGGNVFLDSSGDQGAFTATGTVQLIGADIAGNLVMTGAQLTAGKNGNALTADGLKTGGDVALDSSGDQGAFTATGTVRLVGADITGQLRMTGAQLTAGDALAAGGLKVGGDVFLDSSGDQGAFTATGTVWLNDAQLGNSLYIDDANLKADIKDTALDAEGIQITRRLVWRPANPVIGQVNLEGGSVAQLDDDWTGDRSENNGYWPENLRLDGFTYTTIREDNKAGVSPMAFS